MVNKFSKLPIQINNLNGDLYKYLNTSSNSKKNNYFPKEVIVEENELHITQPQYKIKKFSIQLSPLLLDKPMPLGLAYKSELFRNLPKISRFTKRLKLNINSLKNHFLQTHNKYRQFHDAPLLCYSYELEKSAELWANILAKTGVLAYSQENGHYTENLCEIKNHNLVKGVVDEWYSQSINYDFKNLNHSGNIDKFAAIIWKSSLNVGFGIAVSSDRRIFIVAHYNPPSLQNDSYRENVKQKLSKQLKFLSISPIATLSQLFQPMTKSDLEIFETITLKEINNLRFYHYSPPLKLNRFLSRIALDQANICACNERLFAYNNKSYGVTYLEMILKDLSILNIFTPEHWYAESINYNYSEEPRTPQYQNFTQLIWKTSTEFGIGAASSLGGIIYVIGIFVPPGNISHKYLDNVNSPKNYKNFCSCSCGYVVPRCIKDLKVSVLSKSPDPFAASKNIIDYIPRTYSVFIKDLKQLRNQHKLLSPKTNNHLMQTFDFKNLKSSRNSEIISPKTIIFKFENFLHSSIDNANHPLFRFLPIKNENMSYNLLGNIKCISKFTINYIKCKPKELQENKKNLKVKENFPLHIPTKRNFNTITSCDSNDTLCNIRDSILKSYSDFH